MKTALCCLAAISVNLMSLNVSDSQATNLGVSSQAQGRVDIQRLEMADEQNLLSEYVNNIRPATSTFGEILRENLQEKLNGE